LTVSVLIEGVDYGLRILAAHLGHHHVTRLPLHQGDDLATVGTKDQITSPVTWHSSIFCRWRAFADRDCVADPAVTIGYLRVMARGTHHSRSPEVLQQLLLQGATGLGKEAPIDGLVAGSGCPDT
jgi:hypothetical protein